MNQSSSRSAAGAAITTISLLACLTATSAFASGAKPGGFTIVENASYARPAPPVVVPQVKRWEVPADTPLRQVLQSWAATEGWSVYWPAAADGSEWVTEVGVNFAADDFQSAVTKLIDGLPGKVGLAATFNRANSPMLLHVSESPSMQENR